MAIISEYGMVVYFAILIITVIVFTAINIRNASKADYLVKCETRRLKEHGLLLNHSYKGVSHDDGKTIRFRIFSLNYNRNHKCVIR